MHTVTLVRNSTVIVIIMDNYYGEIEDLRTSYVALDDHIEVSIMICKYKFLVFIYMACA